MEYINRIELQGEVGAVRINCINNCQVANFSLATEHLSMNHLGDMMSEITWHNVVAWEDTNSCDLESITKGSKVRVVGRLRMMKYTSVNGQEKVFYEVIASSVSKIEE